MRFEIGVVAGKFWPYHEGHSYLLHEAASQCERLEILLVGRESQTPSPQDRAIAIYEDMVGENIRIHIIGDIETLDDTEESSQIWAKYAKAIIGTPDVVISSEEYGIRWAGYMGVPHVMIDLERQTWPISGTEVRENYSAASDMLPRSTKPQVLPRVVVMGSESTGTTTLARALGRHYQTVVVPEYGRMLAEDYLEETGNPPPLDYWDDQIFRLVVHGQNALEERLARVANKLLVCDTDSLASAVWYERYNNKLNSTYFDEVGYTQAQKHDLYIITSPEGIPWEDDGTRDGENERAWMHDSFKFVAQNATRRFGIPWIEVVGTPEERLAQAIEAVDKVLDKNAYTVVR